MGNLIRKVRKKLFIKSKDKDVSEVLKGGVVAFLYRIATMLVTYALMIFISKKLGTEGIGIFNICLAVSGILVMVGCVGFNTSVVRFVSQYMAKGWIRTITALYKKMMRYSIWFSLLLGAGLFLLAPIISINLYNDPALILPFQITALTLPFLVIATINVELIRGFKLVQISEFFRNLSLQLTALIGTFIASFFILTAAQPLMFYGLGAVFSFIFTTIFIQKRLAKQNLTIIASEIEPAFSFKYHFLISLPMILTSFIQLINGKIDILMLKYFMSTASVGIFSMAFKLSVITNFVIGALKTIAMPKVSELFWSDKRIELNNVIQYSNRLTFLFAFPISLVLILFPEFILGLIGEEFKVGATTLQIFAATQLINASSGMVAVFLNMTGDQSYFTKIVAITTSINIVLNILLIPILGMEGAAWATMISTVGWNVMGVIFIQRKYNITTYYNPFLRKKKLLKD